jgi:hypothetical protein
MGTGGSVGSGGSSGSGGSPGSGGASGSDAATDSGGDVRADASTDRGGEETGDFCRGLTDAYMAALAEAKQCNPLAKSIQCQATAARSLPCGNCVTHVQDSTKLTEIQMKWTSTGCRSGPCPAIACILPGVGQCVANDGGGGGGTCTDTFPMMK